MGDISAHMNEVSPLLQARATKLIRMLTVKKNPRWHRSRLSVKSASSGKKKPFPSALLSVQRVMKPNQAFFPLSVSLSSFHTKRSAGKKKKKKSATRRARFFQAGMRRISAAASSPPRPSIRRAVRTSLAPAHCTPCSTGRRKEKVDVCVGGCVGGGGCVCVGGLADPFTVTWETPCTFLQYSPQ